MKLKTIGFYRELRHGFKDGESILKQVNKNAAALTFEIVDEKRIEKPKELV